MASDAVDPPSPSILRRCLLDGLLVLFLAGLAFKASFGFGRIRELDAADEVSYLSQGHQLREKGLPTAEAAPVYTLWYHFLSRLCPDPTKTVFLNWEVLAYLLPISLYLLARSLGVGQVAALLVAGLSLGTSLMDIWPYCGSLAAVVLALALAVALRLALPASLMVVGLALLAVTYIRPEVFLAYLLFCPVVLGATAWSWWCQPRTWPTALAALLLFATVSTLTIRTLGNPLQGSRSILAFGQHYAWNCVRAEKSTVNPWYHFMDFVRRDFGDSQSLGEAWRNNSAAVTWHVGRNAEALPRCFAGVAVPHSDCSRFANFCYLPGQVDLLPTPPARRLGRPAYAVLAALLALGLAGLIRRLARPDGRSSNRPVWITLLVLTVLAAPALASCLIVHPRGHYLSAVTTLTWALVAAGLGRAPLPARLRNWASGRLALVALAAGLLILVPNRSWGWNLQAWLAGQKGPPMPPREIYWTAKTLRSLGLKAPIVVLDAEWVRAFYSGLPHTDVFPFEKAAGEGFWRFVRRRDVGVIVLCVALREAAQLRDDPEFRDFLAGATNDFEIFPVGKFDVKLAVRKDLLERSRGP